MNLTLVSDSILRRMFCSVEFTYNQKIQNIFKLQMFADVDNLLARCNSCNYIPFIGGDFNTRMGDLNNLALSWKYETNSDSTTNKHGRIHDRHAEKK